MLVNFEGVEEFGLVFWAGQMCGHVCGGRCDKDLDGRITGEEVKEVIMLSASANKLSKLKDQAAEYAALIMEELDVDRTGYIEVLKFINLFC